MFLVHKPYIYMVLVCLAFFFSTAVERQSIKQTSPRKPHGSKCTIFILPLSARRHALGTTDPSPVVNGVPGRAGPHWREGWNNFLVIFRTKFTSKNPFYDRFFCRSGFFFVPLPRWEKAWRQMQGDPGGSKPGGRWAAFWSFLVVCFSDLICFHFKVRL